MTKMYAMLSQFTVMANGDGEISDLEEKIMSILKNVCQDIESMQHTGFTISSVDKLIDKMEQLGDVLASVGANTMGPLRFILNDLKEIKADLIQDRQSGNPISSPLSSSEMSLDLGQNSENGVGKLDDSLSIDMNQLDRHHKHRQKLEEMATHLMQVYSAVLLHRIEGVLDNIGASDTINQGVEDTQKVSGLQGIASLRPESRNSPFSLDIKGVSEA